MKTVLPRFALAALASALLCSCEHSDVKDTWEDAKEKVGLDDDDSDNTAAGNWSGKSGEDATTTSLVLTDNGTAVSGTATWPASGESRSVSGTRSGRNVILFVDGGATWRLTLKSNKLWGSGEDDGGATYNLSFVR